MAGLSISRAWDESRQILARDGGLLASVALALFALPDIIAGVVSPSGEGTQSLSGRLLNFVVLFIGVIGQLAIVRLALGPSTTVGQAISHGARRFGSLFLAMLLLGVAVILLCVPVVMVLIALGQMDANGQPSGSGSIVLLALVGVLVFLTVKFMLMVSVASAEPIGPVAIVKRSWSLSNGHYLVLLGLEVLLLILAVVLMYAASAAGYVIASVVGGDVTAYSLGALILAIIVGIAQGVFTIIATVMLARIYVQLANRDAAVSVPTSGT